MDIATILLALVSIETLFILYLLRSRKASPPTKEGDSKDPLLGSLAGALGNRYNNLLSAIVGHLSLLGDRCSQDHSKEISAIEQAVEKATKLNKALMVYGSSVGEDSPSSLNSHLNLISPVFELLFAHRCQLEWVNKGKTLVCEFSKMKIQSFIRSILGKILESQGVRRIRYFASKEGGVPFVEFQFDGSANEALERCKASLDDHITIEAIEVDSQRLSPEAGASQRHSPEAGASQRHSPEAGASQTQTSKARNSRREKQSSRSSSKHGILRAYFKGSSEVGTLGEKSKEQKVKEQSKIASLPIVAAENTILIIDDDQAFVRLSRLMLEKAGFSTKCSHSGEEGLDCFRENAGSISAVLLDLAMPGMNGQTTFLHIKKIQEKTPVILCTGYDLSSVEHLKEVGFAGFLQKPLSKQKLLEEIRRVLSKAKEREAQEVELNERAQVNEDLSKVS